LGSLDRLAAHRRGEIVLACLERRPQRGELLLVEVVLDRESLECALLDRPVLLGLGQERLDWVFKNRGQFFSLPSVRELPSPLEPLDAIAGSAGTLDPRVGGMTVRADVGDDLTTRRAGCEGVPARRATDRRQYKFRLKLLQ
jgi:hypothetical protein